jgi:hypothetical protein
MIELPNEFLNLLFTLLMVFASVNRSRRRSLSEGASAPQSSGFHR